MEDEVRMNEYEYGESSDGGDDRVLEWEIGLPNGDDLNPLSQILVPSILSVAFSITPQRTYTMQDVDRASQNTFSSLSSNGRSLRPNPFSFPYKAVAVDDVGQFRSESDPKKQKISDGDEDDFLPKEGESTTEDPSGKTSKRPRLVWTPNLHKRFVDVVTHLDIKNAVPKTIMQLMNVEGLTRENVASHLQKYRLYLNRLQESSPGRPSSSDQLFSSTPPVRPESYQYGGGGGNSSANVETGKMSNLFPLPAVMPMPVYGPGHMGMQGYHHNNHSQVHYHQYNHYGSDMFESSPYMMQQNKYGSMANDK